MSANPILLYKRGSPLADDGDEAVRDQLLKEVSRLELQLDRLKKHDHYLDPESLHMYEEMLESRKEMLDSLS